MTGRPGIEMTGRVCGELTVLRRATKLRDTTSGTWHWLCRCSCGSIDVYDGAPLRSGWTSRCEPCARTGENLAGRTFEEWTVLRRLPDRIREKPGRTAARIAMWECRCSCGTVRPVVGDNLRNGRSRSCGKRGAHQDRATHGNRKQGN